MALVLVLLIVIALHKPTVNLNDYLKVTYGGYDGGGVAYTEIDWNSMKEDFENKISYKGNGANRRYDTDRYHHGIYKC